MPASRYPKKTGNPRRWPDVRRMFYSDEPIATRAKIVDTDLHHVVTQLFEQWLRIPKGDDIEAEWLLANVLDAAIVEQDRRLGIVTELGPRPKVSE
jgi:hypothetical protein